MPSVRACDFSVLGVKWQSLDFDFASAEKPAEVSDGARKESVGNFTYWVFGKLLWHSKPSLAQRYRSLVTLASHPPCHGSPTIQHRIPPINRRAEIAIIS